jgi:S-adenosylmethionine decarboxylase
VHSPDFVGVSKMAEKGIHYIINAYDCKANLDSVEAVRDLLVELVESVKMKRLSEPFVVFHNAENYQNSGVTGIILLSESHVSIHTFSNRGEIYMDLFSCKPYDVEIIRKKIVDFFKIGKLDETIIERGEIL